MSEPVHHVSFSSACLGAKGKRLRLSSLHNWFTGSGYLSSSKNNIISVHSKASTSDKTLLIDTDTLKEEDILMVAFKN